MDHTSGGVKVLSVTGGMDIALDVLGARYKYKIYLDCGILK